MPASLLPLPRFVAFDSNGNPLSGGLVTTQVAGGGPLKTTFQDAAETIPNENPATLDADGSMLMYAEGAVQIITTDALGNQVPAYSGLVSAHLQAGTFALITDLIANALIVTAPCEVEVTGYHVPGDGGAGEFIFLPGDTTSPDNGGTLIVDAAGQRWRRETEGLATNIEWFGASQTNPDNSVQIGSALSSLAASGGDIMIPPGVFSYSIPLALPPNVRLRGEGGSVLRGTTNGMVMVIQTMGAMTYTNSAVLNLTFDGGSSGITGVFCQFTNNVTISDCTFTGIAMPIQAFGCHSLYVDHIVIRGNTSFAGGQIQVGAIYPTGFSAGGYVKNIVHDCSTAFGNIGGTQVSPLILISGTEDFYVDDCYADISTGPATHIQITGSCQGVSVGKAKSIGAVVGILINADGAGHLPSFITIVAPHIDSFSQAGIQIVGPGVNLVSVSGGMITAPTFMFVPCIDLEQVGLGTTITGVVMYQWMNFPAKSGVGIQLNGSSVVAVSSCTFGQLHWAFNFVGTGNGSVVVTNCVEQQCDATVIGNVAAGVNNRLVGNNFVGTPTVTFPLPVSGVFQPNTTGYDIFVSVSGGTVTDISLVGGSTGLTAGTFFLPSGNQSGISIDYSVAPDITVSASQ